MSIKPVSAALFACFAGILLSANSLVAAEDDASRFIEFYEEADEDCEKKGGARIFVKNTHEKQIIDLHLARYFYDVRQGGRSMFPLKPSDSQALGCSRVFDAEQRWELVSATFISEAGVNERYGDQQ